MSTGLLPERSEIKERWTRAPGLGVYARVLSLSFMEAESEVGYTIPGSSGLQSLAG